MKHLKLIIGLLLIVVIFSGFWSGKSKREIREENRLERVERIRTNNETLQLLYKYAPEARDMVLRSYGYATFSNVGVNIVLFSAEGGKGMAHNNRTGVNTYMNMASGGVGLGLGVKDFRAVFLFENKKVYDTFVRSGWEANAQADAAAKYKESGRPANGATSDYARRENEFGGAINAAETVAPGIRLYKMTQSGLALQATVQGTKYWKDKELNKN
jgi:lipid-binding SYLF domain-containing protein